MRIRRRYAVILAVVAAGAVVGSGFALAATTSDFQFSFSPNKVPKKKYKGGALKTNLVTSYDNPSAATAVDRTRIYLDKNFKIDPKKAKTCDASQLSGTTMAGAMANCKKALVGKGKATASANGQFTINSCVLLFNGKKQGKKPTLQVFTRSQATNPSNISCKDPAHNNEGTNSILLTGVLKNASGKYGKVLDVNHISQATAGLPLEIYNTTIKKGKYFSARCKAKNHKWNMQVKWDYKDGTATTVKQSQKCKVKK